MTESHTAATCHDLYRCAEHDPMARDDVIETAARMAAQHGAPEAARMAARFAMWAPSRSERRAWWLSVVESIRDAEGREVRS